MTIRPYLFWQTMHSGFVAVVVSWHKRYVFVGELPLSFLWFIIENGKWFTASLQDGERKGQSWPWFESSWATIPSHGWGLWDRRMGCQIQNILECSEHEIYLILKGVYIKHLQLLATTIDMFGFHSSPPSADWSGYAQLPAHPALNRFQLGRWDFVTRCLQIGLILPLWAQRFTVNLAKRRNKIKQNHLPWVHGHWYGQ